MQRKRRSIRLKGYDYAQPGAYFVTICAHNGEHLFGSVRDDAVHLSVFGQIAAGRWQTIPQFFPQVLLDAFVIMPNHLHGILWIVADDVGARHSAAELTVYPGSPAPNASPLPRARPNGADASSLGAIIGNFKSTTARRINQRRNAVGMPVWQRNYYEHIIRTDEALFAIRRYIEENPQRWSMDRYHPAPTGTDPRATEIWRLLRNGWGEAFGGGSDCVSRSSCAEMPRSYWELCAAWGRI